MSILNLFQKIYNKNLIYRYPLSISKRYSSEDLVVNNSHRLDSDIKYLFSSSEKKQENDIKDSKTINTPTSIHRKHPGIVNCRKIKLPNDLTKAVQYLIQKYPTSKLQERCDTMERQLWSRKLPAEKSQINEKVQEIRMSLDENDTVDWLTLDAKEKETEQLKYRNKAVSKLNKSLYHWKQINYNAMNGFIYMASRIANDYSVSYRILNEIKLRDTEFKPKRLLDVGSGVGSNIWSASELWPDSLVDYNCVDVSEDMNTISRLLLQGGKEEASMKINNVFYRKSIPSDISDIDLVISTFSLMEFSDQNSRLNFVLQLWKSTSNYLVLAENGTNAGFRAILEARDFILQLGNKGFPAISGEQAIVSAPCPHDVPCPRFMRNDKTPCNFIQNFQNINKKNKSEDISRFSYIVLKKSEIEYKRYPRIVRPVSKAARKVNCRLCSSQGLLETSVITAKKNGKDFYWCSRNCNWGDMLPSVEEMDISLGNQSNCNDIPPSVHDDHEDIIDQSTHDHDSSNTMDANQSSCSEDVPLAVAGVNVNDKTLNLEEETSKSSKHEIDSTKLKCDTSNL